MKLMLVESPSKARKIAGYLGEGWQVEATRGHLRDLPDAELGVDVKQGFRPTYQVVPGKHKLVTKLIKQMRSVDEVYLATDPDREGEAIAWHLLELAQIKTVKRVTFNAITQQAVHQALEQVREVDVALVEAQQTRRIIDRLVGYLVSPLASKALDQKVSTGRVQSAALQLVVQRQQDIDAFTPQDYWTLDLQLQADGITFPVEVGLEGRAMRFAQQVKAEKLKALLASATYIVEKVASTRQVRQPLPPFTTSTLQQVAANTLGLTPERTMKLAQLLYEQGQITYHRTDGVYVAQSAQESARDYIAGEYGQQFLPDTAPQFQTKAKNAQEAHEAIRPTDVTQLPDSVSGDGAKLYALIWNRFVSSQMAPAEYQLKGALLQAKTTEGKVLPLQLKAVARKLTFAGFLSVYDLPTDDGEFSDQSQLPDLQQGQTLYLSAVTVEAKQTRAPATYSEASLIQELEKRGIGRPSTYASTLKTLKDKQYLVLKQKRLVPTDTAYALCDFVAQHFPTLSTADYTAELENALDDIAQGKQTRSQVLTDFWRDFQGQLASVSEVVQPQKTDAKPVNIHPIEASA